MSNNEGLYDRVISELRPNIPVVSSQGLSADDNNWHFAMSCNGYFMHRNGKWNFNLKALTPFIQEFAPQQVSFFGPGGADYKFFSKDQVSSSVYETPLRQPLVTELIRKLRRDDEDLAARVAFLLGGIGRHQLTRVPGLTQNDLIGLIGFAADITSASTRKSADAVASATAMYIISGGALVTDGFRRRAYYMGESVDEDLVTPSSTEYLGLSQLARLRYFSGAIGGETQALLDIEHLLEDFKGFPTVGAEFHFDPDAPNRYRDFWQRLAILNMSQYQRGSYIQMSRNDSGVIEVRMNPSVYPVTVANWMYIRSLLPEIKRNPYSITFNRQGERQDFSWSGAKGAPRSDSSLLYSLRALGLMMNAGKFEGISATKQPGEIQFGSIYLGQTVRVHKGKYKFTGMWESGEGKHGQLSVYAGYGDLLPDIACYLSMVLANPDVLGPHQTQILNRVRSLPDAFALSTQDRRLLFMTLKNRIEQDDRLGRAFRSGHKIIEMLGMQQVLS